MSSQPYLLSLQVGAGIALQGLITQVHSLCQSKAISRPTNTARPLALDHRSPKLMLTKAYMECNRSVRLQPQMHHLQRDVPNVQPKILDAGSWIKDPGTRILDPGYWITDPGTRILDPGSWIMIAGSQILDSKVYVFSDAQLCVHYIVLRHKSHYASQLPGWLWHGRALAARSSQNGTGACFETGQ